MYGRSLITLVLVNCIVHEIYLKYSMYACDFDCIVGLSSNSFPSLVCRIETTGADELSKPLTIVVNINEGSVSGSYYIEGKAKISGFTFVVTNFGFILFLCYC